MPDYSHIEVIQLLKKLVSIESTNVGSYEKEIGDFIYHWLETETAGTGVSLLRDEALPGRYNIVAELKGEIERPNFVFITHMDTVPVGNGWTKDPFKGEIIDGKLYGRGALDMKQGVASAMIVFRDLAKSGKRPKHSILFIGSVDEEGNVMQGAVQAVKNGWINKDSWVLDTEPTAGYIMGAHKGKTWFEIKTKGKPAHGSVPQMGIDAIAAMGEIISELRARIAQWPGTEEMGPSTICFGTVQGGVNTNIVADECTLTIDMRLSHPLTTEGSIHLVVDAIQAGTQKVPGSSGTYRIIAARPYILMDEEAPLYLALKKAAEKITGKPPVTMLLTGYTDSGVATAECGCINAMSYGAKGNNAHQADEYVDCGSVLTLVDVLHELMNYVS